MESIYTASFISVIKIPYSPCFHSITYYMQYCDYHTMPHTTSCQCQHNYQHRNIQAPKHVYYASCTAIVGFSYDRHLTLYPGLLTTAFVACSANTGEGLVKLIRCNDVPGCVEEWHIPSVQL